MPMRESAADAALDQQLLDAIPKGLPLAEAKEAVEAVDMRAKSPLIAGLLKDSANGPNNLQMALA